AGAERAQVTALAAGRAGGVVLGDLGEIGAAFDGSFQLVARSCGGAQDVAGGGSGHGVLLRLEKSSSLPQSSAIRNAVSPRVCCHFVRGRAGACFYARQGMRSEVWRAMARSSNAVSEP